MKMSEKGESFSKGRNTRNYRPDAVNTNSDTQTDQGLSVKGFNFENARFSKNFVFDAVAPKSSETVCPFQATYPTFKYSENHSKMPPTPRHHHHHQQHLFKKKKKDYKRFDVNKCIRMEEKQRYQHLIEQASRIVSQPTITHNNNNKLSVVSNNKCNSSNNNNNKYNSSSNNDNNKAKAGKEKLVNEVLMREMKGREDAMKEEKGKKDIMIEREKRREGVIKEKKGKEESLWGACYKHQKGPSLHNASVSRECHGIIDVINDDDDDDVVTCDADADKGMGGRKGMAVRGAVSEQSACIDKTKDDTGTHRNEARYREAFRRNCLHSIHSSRPQPLHPSPPSTIAITDSSPSPSPPNLSPTVDARKSIRFNGFTASSLSSRPSSASSSSLFRSAKSPFSSSSSLFRNQPQYTNKYVSSPPLSSSPPASSSSSPPPLSIDLLDERYQRSRMLLNEITGPSNKKQQQHEQASSSSSSFWQESNKNSKNDTKSSFLFWKSKASSPPPASSSPPPISSSSSRPPSSLSLCKKNRASLGNYQKQHNKGQQSTTQDHHQQPHQHHNHHHQSLVHSKNKSFSNNIIVIKDEDQPSRNATKVHISKIYLTADDNDSRYDDDDDDLVVTDHGNDTLQALDRCTYLRKYEEAMSTSPYSREEFLQESGEGGGVEERLMRVRETEVVVEELRRRRRTQSSHENVIMRMKNLLNITSRIEIPVKEDYIHIEDEEEEEESADDDLEVLEEGVDEFPELSREQQARVDQILASPNSSKVVVEAFKLQLTHKDLSTLAGLNWLNDEVINFYMSMLVERSEVNKKLPSAYAFNTFFYPKVVSGGQKSVRRWTKNVDLFQHHLILIPVHLGFHWCLAVIDMRSKQVRYYDSMGGHNKNLECILTYLVDEMKDKQGKHLDTSGWSTTIVKDIPQQMNGSDCGMFACKFAEYLCRNARITFDQSHMPYFRRRMIYEIATKKLM